MIGSDRHGYNFHMNPPLLASKRAKTFAKKLVQAKIQKEGVEQLANKHNEFEKLQSRAHNPLLGNKKQSPLDHIKGEYGFNPNFF